ncbi:Anp1-domain-containing protein [Tricharina praecox]|uniref:Anp1-domain-containing protein n=1 Tax=Tricharina praecox TaxID=43433 RepID=UPI00221E71F1|nr:Anp1-domain-containing protein [Tricharina praecox]KAI5857189.1 Anp1-domain-containing protein [Tricharina praecox]
MLTLKGMSVKTVRNRLPPLRAVASIFSRTRFWFLVFLSAFIVILWRGVNSSAANMQKYYCFGPAKSPLEISQNEHAKWHMHHQTPVLFNHHKPIEVNASTIQYIDLNKVSSTTDAIKNKERILILTPLRDAAYYLPKHFELVAQLTYPHELIDLAFLVSDSTDDTLAVLAAELDRVQNQPDPKLGGPFHSVTIVQKDYGVAESQDVTVRHSFEFQGPRRKAMGMARNFLLSATLTAEHSWVYWRDVDIVENPKSIIEDFIKHDKDILVPNIWFHRYEGNHDIEGRFDYNSWQESPEALKLAASLPKDTVLAEGYAQYDTKRKHMAMMGSRGDNPDEEIELDGIGGVNILVKADVHRAGINFPCYAFENQAETEGFAKMAKRAGYQVIGLPNYVVWHLDTDEKPGNLKGRPA